MHRDTTGSSHKMRDSRFPLKTGCAESGWPLALALVLACESETVSVSGCIHCLRFRALVLAE